MNGLEVAIVEKRNTVRDLVNSNETYGKYELLGAGRRNMNANLPLLSSPFANATVMLRQVHFDELCWRPKRTLIFRRPVM